MSRTPYFFVERPDTHTGKYELQHPLIWNFNHTKRIPADLYPYNGDHELFSILEEGGEFPEMKGIHYGLPKNVSEDIKKEFDACGYDIDLSSGSRHIEPKVRWFTYADMYIYCLKYPNVKDYDAIEEAYYYAQEGEKIDENIIKPTPMKNLKNRVDAFLEVMDGWGWENDYSQIRIVYWIN